jgi:hypothetical protein
VDPSVHDSSPEESVVDSPGGQQEDEAKADAPSPEDSVVDSPDETKAEAPEVSDVDPSVAASSPEDSVVDSPGGHKEDETKAEAKSPEVSGVDDDLKGQQELKDKVRTWPSPPQIQVVPLKYFGPM